MKAFFGSRKTFNTSETWNAIKNIESMSQSNSRKTAFTYNRDQRNSLCYSGCTTVNGAPVQKLRVVHMRGDLTITKNRRPTLKNL